MSTTQSDHEEQPESIDNSTRLLTQPGSFAGQRTTMKQRPALVAGAPLTQSPGGLVAQSPD
jgi:hypothetical protein